LNHVEIIFIAGGYTPARQTPQAKREMLAVAKPSTQRRAALHAAPRIAAIANSIRDGMMSARLSTATTAVPTTKPNCTLVVRPATCEPDNDHRSCNCGAMALPA